MWFSAKEYFWECCSAGPTPQPPNWSTKVSLFVWPLTLILSSKGDPTSSYATAGIALGILEVSKPNYPVQSTLVKVEIPSIETNEYIRGKMDVQDMILDDITRKQLLWYGHVERMDTTRLPKIMIHWKTQGRKKRGRPRKTWKDGIYTVMNEKDLRMDEWNNRRQWNMKIGRRRQTF